MASWDPRTPEWEGAVRGAIVRIYDMAAYEQSKVDYPDDPQIPKPANFADNGNSSKPSFIEKKKPQARYNWVHRDIAKEIAG